MSRAVLTGLVAAAAAATSASAGSYSPPPGDHKPVWSPDGSAIVYLARASPTRHLRVMAPDGSGNRALPLPSFSDVGPTPFVFSPDWFWVAVADSVLDVSRPDGSERRRVADRSWKSMPAWSPDGRRLAFTQEDGLYAAGVDGSDRRRLTSRGAGTPAWSPDGELIAFTTTISRELEIVLVRPDGSGERVLTEHLPGRHRQPVWSPDGSRLAFLTSIDEGNWIVSVTTRDGALVAQLTPGIYVSSVEWSRDGRRLLLSAVGVAVAEIETRRIDVVAPFGSEAVWAPSGDEIAFQSGGECKDRSGIYRARADGSSVTRLTNDCRLVGTANADQIQGTALADVILGLEGNDILGAFDAAYVGDDVYGGPGDDTLTGHYLGNRLEGGPGDDRIEARWGPDLVRGGPGQDVLDAQGGRDYVDADDGVRDLVECGTNPNPWPPAELDTAFVDTLDRASGCELLYRNGRANLRAGRTALTIRVGRVGARRSWTLRCRPAGGTLPNAGAACRRLATMRSPLAPVAYDRPCPTAPVVASQASVRGLFAGKRVVVPFGGSNACEVERWNRHRFLLAPR